MERWLPIATPVNLTMMCLCVGGVLLKKTDGGGSGRESFIKPRVETHCPDHAGLGRGRAVMEVPTWCRRVGLVGAPSSPVPMLRPGSGGCSDKTESDGIWTCFKHGWALRAGAWVRITLGGR